MYSNMEQEEEDNRQKWHPKISSRFMFEAFVSLLKIENWAYLQAHRFAMGLEGMVVYIASAYSQAHSGQTLLPEGLEPRSIFFVIYCDWQRRHEEDGVQAEDRSRYVDADIQQHERDNSSLCGSTVGSKTWTEPETSKLAEARLM